MKDVLAGQAIHHGVLFLIKDKYAITVQGPKKAKSQVGHLSPHVLRKVPFIRGLFVLWIQLQLTVQAIHFSARVADDDEDWNMFAAILTLIVSLSLALILFKLVPYFITTIFFTSANSATFSLLDGLIRILILIAYLFFIRFHPDVKILFEYHGAEHKVINTYEKGKTLSVENVQKESRTHYRCSTSFLILTLLLAILLFAIIPIELGTVVVFLVRLVLLVPLIAISYEVHTIFAKHPDNVLVKFLLQPGFLLQKITTREPNDQQVNIAITCVKKVLS